MQTSWADLGSIKLQEWCVQDSEVGESENKAVVGSQVREDSSGQTKKLKGFPATTGAFKGTGRGASGIDLGKISGNPTENEFAYMRLEVRSPALRPLQLQTVIPSNLLA